MPRVTDQDPEFEVSMPQQSGQGKPVVKCKVVYLGSKRNKSIPLKGKVVIERIGEGDDMVETRTPITTGNTTYDFWTHNTMGRPLPKEFFMPANHKDAEVRGKRFTWCEHPDHLFRFQSDPSLREPPGKNGEPVFKIIATSREDMLVLQEYFRAKARLSRRTESDYALITTTN